MVAAPLFASSYGESKRRRRDVEDHHMHAAGDFAGYGRLCRLLRTA